MILLLLPRLVEASSPPDSSFADTLRLPSPRGALIRSALLPGWGQYYNRKPLKAVFFAATSAAFLGAAISAQQALNEAAPLERGNRAARRNTRFLLLALDITFSALDAYVDAHLADFDPKGEFATLDPRPGGAVLRLAVTWPLH